MKHTYTPNGVCSNQITFELSDGRVRNVVFRAGCDGNLKAISKLVEGMEADRVVTLLSGNTCGYKNTSCTDQLARAILAAKRAEARG
ncbi:MAG: TIGR03905 family TSCPD domain-containing protein [Eubacteriales bacterium]|nr:TIGR03905 family TSCPD domain-containing protein [Eubacteriales bacterium]